jgi:hypothetical protein
MRKTPGSFLSSRLPSLVQVLRSPTIKDAQKKTDELLAYLRIVDLNETVAITGEKMYATLFKEWSNDRVR